VQPILGSDQKSV